MSPTHPLFGSEDTAERLLYCQKVCIGLAAMNIQYTIDPLHIFINARKDAARLWNDVFLGPLYQLITGKNYKEKMSMAEIEGLQDVLLAAWIHVRPHVLPALQAIAHSRFDVAAFIWHFEVSLCIPVILYDFLLRAEGNAGEAYYDLLLYALLETIIRQRHNYPAALCRKISAIFYLQSKQHDQARVLLRGCHIMDAAFGEHGVNALLRNILQGVTDDDQGHTKALLYFAKRSSPAGCGLANDMGADPHRIKFVFGRSMTTAVVHAQTLIQDIAISLIGAELTNKLPVRVPYRGANRFTSNSYMCPAFFLDRVLEKHPLERQGKAKKMRFNTFQNGSSAYAMLGVSPDDRKGCHMIGCTQPNLPGGHLYLICGHSCCGVCFAKSPRCRDCLLQAAVRIEHVAKTERETQRTRLIDVTELHETALSKTEQEEQAEADLAEKDADADDNTGQAGAQAGEDDQGGSGSLIDLAKKKCQRLIQAALASTQAHRAAAIVNAFAGIPGKQPLVPPQYVIFL